MPDTRKIAPLRLAFILIGPLAAASIQAAPPAPPAPAAAAKAPAPAPKLSKTDQAKLLFNEANRLLKSGKNQEAAANYLQALNLDPTLVPAVHNLSVLYIRAKQWPQAEAALRRITLLQPKDPGPWLELAGAQKAGGQPGASRDTLQKAAALFPASVEVRLALAQAFEADGLPSQAEAQLQAAVDANPKSVDAVRNLANFYYRHKREDDFARTLETLWALQPKDPQIALNIAMLAHQKKDWAKAVTYYKAAARLDPTQEMAWQNLGVIYLQLKRPGPAQDVFQRAAKLEPNKFAPWMGLGIAAFQNGQMAAAEKAFRQAVKLQPKNTEARMNLASSLMRQNKLKEAETVYAALRREGSTDPQVLKALVYLYGATGRKNLALELNRKAAAAHPGDADFHLNQAKLYWQAHKLDAAIAELKKARELKPDDDQIAPMLAALETQARRFDEAIPLYETLAQKDPSAYGSLADLYAQQKQPDKQIETLKAWEAADPKSAKPLLALAQAYEGRNQPEDAAVAYEKARALEPGDAPVALAVAAYYHRRNDPAKAEETLREAAKASPKDPVLNAALADEIAGTKPDEAEALYRLAALSATTPQEGAMDRLKAASLLRKRDTAAGDSELAALAKQYPADLMVQSQWSAALAEDKRFGEAIAAMKGALLATPPEGNFNWLGGVFQITNWAREKDQLPAAASALQALAGKYPDNGMLLSQVGRLLSQQYASRTAAKPADDPGAAWFMRLRAQHPDRPEIVYALAEYLGQRGMVTDEIALLKKQAERDQKSPMPLNGLGSVYKSQKLWDAAVNAYKEAIRRAPNDAYYRTALAQTYEAAGKPDDALAAWKDARKMEPNNAAITQAIDRLSGKPAPPAADAPKP